MSNAVEMYKKGMTLFGQGRFDEAIASYDLALQERPDWADALHGKAMAHMKAGRLDDAIAIGRRIIELDPDDAFAHTSLSIFYQRKGMIEEAEKEAAKARMISWKEDLKKNPHAPPPGPAGGMSVVQ